MLPFARFTSYFLEVVRQGSLRKAAGVLHVSASAIDRQILQAERVLDAALFERLPTGLKLTGAGEMLLNDTRRWTKEYSRTLERLDELKGLKRGHVKIAVIEALGEGIVVRTIAEICRELPHLTFDLEVLSNRQVGEQVSAAEVDFGLLLEPVEHAGLEIRALAEIPLGIAMPVDHPLAGRTRISLSTALAYRHLISAAPLIVHERAKSLYVRHKVDYSHVVGCNNVMMMKSLIRAGIGIGILSLLDVASDCKDGRLAFVPLQGKAVKPLSLALCVAPRRQLSRAALLVIQRLSIAMKHLV
jgi:DNA-binding transcriptional LysR family regulator